MQALADNTELISDFRIERVLGAGGFGITYLAREVDLDRLVTIKEYFPGDFAMRATGSVDALPRSEECATDYQWGLDRFIEEAQTLAKFDHPNIVRVYRYFRANNTGYMVLHFEEGESFKSWLAGLGRAPRQAELDQFIGPLLDALSVVHGSDFLHRDIAPDNIIIRNDGSPVLIDFGAARGEIARHSRTVSALVKPGYSPYEQYGEIGRSQGPWTDIYALAATLYHAITGKRPPDAPSRVVNDELRPAQEAALSAYRAGFLKAIDRALRLDIDKRPQTVAEWRGALLAPEAPSSGLGWFGGLSGGAGGGAGRVAEADQDGGEIRTLAVTKPLSPAPSDMPPPPDLPLPADHAKRGGEAKRAGEAGRRGRIVDFLEGARRSPRETARIEEGGAAQPGDGGLRSALRDAASGNEAGSRDAPGSEDDAAEPPRKRFGLLRRSRMREDDAGAAAAAATVPSPKDRPVDFRSAPNVPVGPKPKRAAAARRKSPKPRPGRTKSRWRFVPLATKLAAGIVIATLLVRFQQSLPHFEYRSHGTVASAPAAVSNNSISRQARAGGQSRLTTGSLDRRLRQAPPPSPTPAPGLNKDATGRASAIALAGVAPIRRAPQTLLVRTIAAHKGGASDVAFTADGGQIATVGGDGLLKVWDAKSYDLVRTIEIEDGPALTLTVAGQRALTGHENGRIALWDLTLGMQLKTFKRNDAPITTLAFAGSQRFLAGANDWSVALWEVATPSVPLHVFEGHGRDVLAVAYEPNLGLIASASADRTFKLWEAKGLSHMRTYPRQRDFITALAFTPGGDGLAIGTLSGVVSLYSTKSRRRLKRYRGHGGRITSLKFLGGGRDFVSASHDGTVRLWNRRGGRPLQTFGSAGAKVMGAAVSPNGRFIATAKANGSVQVWNAAVLD